MAVLAQVAALVPAGLEVVVVADRAYAIPPFLDRLRAYGWHWVLRLTTTGSHRWCDRHGREHALRDVLAAAPWPAGAALARARLPVQGRRLAHGRAGGDVGDGAEGSRWW